MKDKIKFRHATIEDLPDIVQMIANDKLGQTREAFTLPLPDFYNNAYRNIHADPNQELIVLEYDNKVIGTLQLSFIQYLTYKGGTRAQIEQVRIHENFRGQGLGTVLFEWAIAKAKDKGAHVLQLTTDKKRPEALNFYKQLGFKDSHEGMKLHF